MTRSGFTAMMASHIDLICSSSIWRIRFQSSSLLTSMLVWLSPFLYSSGQSRRTIRGLRINLRILGCVISLLSMTPSNTVESSIWPPGTFSILAYRLVSTSILPPCSSETVRTALRASPHMRSDQRDTNLVPIEPEMSLYICLSSLMSTGFEMPLTINWASARARLKAEMMTTGWILRSSWGRACARISPAIKELERWVHCYQKNDAEKLTNRE